MDILSVLRDLAIIVVFAKVFGLIARKLKAPQVVGEIIAGLIVGPSVFGIVKLNDFLDICAGIGVVLLMAFWCRLSAERCCTCASTALPR